MLSHVLLCNRLTRTLHPSSSNVHINVLSLIAESAEAYIYIYTLSVQEEPKYIGSYTYMVCIENAIKYQRFCIVQIVYVRLLA